MSYLTNKEQMEKICQLEGFNIVGTEQGADYELVEFTFDMKEYSAHGNYELRGEFLNFNICYSIENEEFDVEHVTVNGEESVIFQNIGSYSGTAYLKDGMVNKISIEEFPAKAGKIWTFSSKHWLRFMTLDRE